MAMTLGDFGAATRYECLLSKNKDVHSSIEGIEVRAFGCLVEELVERVKSDTFAELSDIIDELKSLKDKCFDVVPASRPRFVEIETKIVQLKQDLEAKAKL